MKRILRSLLLFVCAFATLTASRPALADAPLLPTPSTSPATSDGSAPSPDGGPGRKRRPPLHEILARYADRLQLDENARAEIRIIADATRGESEPLEQELRDLHDEMRSLLERDEPDLEATLLQADRIGAVETSLHKLRLRSMLQIRVLLTPEQRQELVRIHAERRKERKGEPPPEPSPSPAP